MSLTYIIVDTFSLAAEPLVRALGARGWNVPEPTARHDLPEAESDSQKFFSLGRRTPVRPDNKHLERTSGQLQNRLWQPQTRFPAASGAAVGVADASSYDALPMAPDCAAAYIAEHRNRDVVLVVLEPEDGFRSDAALATALGVTTQLCSQHGVCASRRQAREFALRRRESQWWNLTPVALAWMRIDRIAYTPVSLARLADSLTVEHRRAQVLASAVSLAAREGLLESRDGHVVMQSRPDRNVRLGAANRPVRRVWLAPAQWSFAAMADPQALTAFRRNVIPQLRQMRAGKAA